MFVVSLFCLLPLSVAPLLSLSLSTCSLSCSSTSMWSKPPRNTKPLHSRTMRKTSAAIFQDEFGDIDTEPSCSCDAELDDEIIGKTLSSALFIQEREEPLNLRQAFDSYEESLWPAQSFSTHSLTGRPENEPSSSQERKSSRDMENERIRILLERANSR